MPTADRSGAASGASRLVTEFLQAMAADRGLARNSLAAYRRDLEACLEALAASGCDFTSCAAEDLRGLLAGWRDQGLAARSVARRLSALRQMMSWLVEERIRDDNPCRWIDNPKQPASLPKSLSETEIASLIAAARAVSPAGDASRMTAMLELLYATGLRVSELVSLPVDQFRRDLETIIVTGKGGKERLVALGAPARAAVARWMECVTAPRPMSLRLSVPHSHMTASSLRRRWAACPGRGHRPAAGQPACGAAQLRHTYAEPGS